jgi:hypothetical protein
MIIWTRNTPPRGLDLCRTTKKNMVVEAGPYSMYYTAAFRERENVANLRKGNARLQCQRCHILDKFNNCDYD